MIYIIKRATRQLFFWSLMLIALSLTTVRVLLYKINDYKVELAAEISERVGAPVIIGGLSAHMRGYSPQLVLTDINVLSTAQSFLPQQPNKPIITLKEIRLGINLLDFLLSQDYWAASWITLVGVKLDVKRKLDGSIGIVGLKASDEKPLWLLQGGKYEVLQSSVTWRDELINGKPLVFDAVDMAIINKGQEHTINVLMDLPEKFGDSLTVSMVLDGNLLEPSAINGSGFFEGKALNLPQWITLDLPLALKLDSGTGDFKIWFKMDHSQFHSIDGEINLQRLLLSRPDKNTFASKKLSSSFNWSANNAQWLLTINQFLLETADKKWLPAAFSIAGYGAEDKQLHKLALFIEQMDLQETASLVQFFAPLGAEQSSLLKKANPKGIVNDFSLFIDLDEKHGAVNGKFGKLAIEPVLSAPGLTNIDVQIAGSDQQGQLLFNTKNAHIISTNLFNESIPVSKLEGSLAWQQSEDVWSLSTESILINLPSVQTKTRVNIKLPKNNQPIFMDLQIAFANDDLRQIPRYLPGKVMDAKLLDWLNHAFIGSGRIPSGGLLFYGNLADFPFKRGQGVFETLFTAEQVDLLFRPDWPTLSDLGGEVLFLNESMKINVKQGQSNKVNVKQAEINIPVVGKSKMLGVKGEFDASIIDALYYLQKTPLILPIAKLLDSIIPEGNTVVKVDTQIPFEDNIMPVVNGTADFNNARLTVKSLDLVVKQITGQLKFNEQSTFSNAIKAETLEQPIQINLNSNASLATVNVTGKSELGELEKQFKLPKITFAEGTLDYQMQLKLFYDNQPPILDIQSSLKGMSLNLPDNLAKSKDEKRVLTVDFDFSRQHLIPINLNYDNKLKAAINIDPGQHQIQSGNILIGSGNVTNTQKPGVRLEINREKLALQNWLEAGLSLPQDKNSLNENLINNIKIHTENSSWKSALLGVFDLNLKNESNFWVGDLSNKFAKGRLKIPSSFQGENRITIGLEKLDLAFIKLLKPQPKVQQLAPQPEFLPLVTFSSEKTSWNNVELGQLTLENKRMSDGIAFNKIDLQNADQHLALTGDWKLQGAKSRSHFEGSLEIPQTGKQFSKLGISNDLSETEAEFNINATWAGMPQQFTLETLQARVDVLLKNGRILSIEPGGLGRIVGILALAQWVKRLQLDFGDVYKDGLTFDSIKGHFDFANAKAETHDLVIDAVPAKITIEGSYDLLKENMNFIVTVVPKSAEAVPIAGNIMGKVASVIGQTLTGKNQDGFLFGSQYQVTGAFGNIKVVPIHENDGLLQKTWNGLTSFPWMKN